MHCLHPRGSGGSLSLVSSKYTEHVLARTDVSGVAGEALRVGLRQRGASKLVSCCSPKAGAANHLPEAEQQLNNQGVR